MSSQNPWIIPKPASFAGCDYPAIADIFSVVIIRGLAKMAAEEALQRPSRKRR
jgi:hypothetical protein